MDKYPWMTSPPIANAPMGGFAGGALAAAVTQSGGLGFIGSVMTSDLEKELSLAASLLSSHPHSQEGKGLPIGVGLLPFVVDMDAALPVLRKYQPSVIWLFAAKNILDYADLSHLVREACPNAQLWIQVGTVTAALSIAQTSSPDALILQGGDAGGHGFERGASIISLIPETLDTLSAHGLSHISVLASGGIADARGAAAAFALGASGVVLGTRFLAAKETNVPEGYRQLVLDTKDGSTNTVRSKLFDNVKGPNIWPDEYDGRSLVTKSYEDHVNGVGIEEVRSRHNETVGGKDGGYGREGRANVWAGASVGLVTRVQSAADIVEELRNGVGTVLKSAQARL
jgi:nitronate monooxygenase